jgi:hypothetical protein
VSRRNAICLAVVLVTPPVAAAIASFFSLAVGNLFPALPAMVVANVVNVVAALMARLPTDYESAAHSAAIFYASAGTFIYCAITVEIVEWF